MPRSHAAPVLTAPVLTARCGTAFRRPLAILLLIFGSLCSATTASAQEAELEDVPITPELIATLQADQKRLANAVACTAGTILIVHAELPKDGSPPPDDFVIPPATEWQFSICGERWRMDRQPEAASSSTSEEVQLRGTDGFYWYRVTPPTQERAYVSKYALSSGHVLGQAQKLLMPLRSLCQIGQTSYAYFLQRPNVTVKRGPFKSLDNALWLIGSMEDEHSKTDYSFVLDPAMQHAVIYQKMTTKSERTLSQATMHITPERHDDRIVPRHVEFTIRAHVGDESKYLHYREEFDLEVAGTSPDPVVFEVENLSRLGRDFHVVEYGPDNQPVDAGHAQVDYRASKAPEREMPLLGQNVDQRWLWLNVGLGMLALVAVLLWQSRRHSSKSTDRS